MKFLANMLFVFVLASFSIASFVQAIDINTATTEQMNKALNGIGPRKAADIVKYREANGPLKSTDDLAKVSGIKGKALDKIKSMVTLDGVTPAMPATPAKPLPLRRCFLCPPSPLQQCLRPQQCQSLAFGGSGMFGINDGSQLDASWATNALSGLSLRYTART